MRRKAEWPDRPGWYPDPWSATGAGERYFDGKRWGSTEKPLARHSGSAPATTMTKRRRRLRLPMPFRSLLILAIFLGGSVWYVSRTGRQPSRTSAKPTTNLPLDRPPPGHEEAARPLGVPPPVPVAAGRFEFLHYQPDAPTVPVAFDPCRPIHYVMNLDDAPPDGQELAMQAIGRIQTATGLHFISDGTTTEPPSKDRKPYQPERYGSGRYAPVLITWSTEQAYPPLAGYIAGLGGPEMEYTPDHRLVYVSGDVILDAGELSPGEMPDRNQARATILHELGHVVGLDHTNDREQIMFSEGRAEITEYGPGDLRGLAVLGQGACHPDI